MTDLDHEAGHSRSPGKADPGHPTGGGDMTDLDHEAGKRGQDELRGYREVKERQWWVKLYKVINTMCYRVTVLF